MSGCDQDQRTPEEENTPDSTEHGPDSGPTTVPTGTENTGGRPTGTAGPNARSIGTNTIKRRSAQTWR